MRVLLAAALLAAPFWETKPPREWTEQELRLLTEDSPWAQVAEPAREGVAPGVQLYLATATPLREAEAEIARRRKISPDLLREEYEAFLREEGTKSIVLAVYAPDLASFAEGDAVRHIQNESALKIGRKRLKMTGHFPPTASDPYLRIVFPRPETADAKALSFEIYVPGIPSPYRQAEFRLKDLVYKGKPDY
jgi:hypothetical protein